MEQEVRWHQRFSNCKKALYKLEQAVEYINRDNEEELESDYG